MRRSAPHPSSQPAETGEENSHRGKKKKSRRILEGWTAALPAVIYSASLSLPYKVTRGLPLSFREIREIRPAEFMASLPQGQEDPMQAKSTDIVFSLLRTCCLAVSFASCRNSSWHLAATQKGAAVELCLSNGVECPQAGGISPGSISVYRWDNLHDNEL